MQGSILDYSVQHNTGIISGDDQNRYQFTGSEWRGQALPARGQRVDFEVLGQGQAKDVYLVSAPNPFTNQVGQKIELLRHCSHFSWVDLVYISFI